MSNTTTVTLNSRERERIRKANERFESMSKRDKRIAIAKDVIAQINADIYTASRGQYISFVGDKISYDKTIQSCSPSALTCICCARGAAIISAARLFNQTNLTTEDWEQTWGGDASWNIYERKFFTPRMSRMMEVAFERDTVGEIIGNVEKTDIDAARKYGYDLSDDANQRLKQIMQNIIDNNGMFVVPKEYYQ